jgi:hypothetical protein
MTQNPEIEAALSETKLDETAYSEERYVGMWRTDEYGDPSSAFPVIMGRVSYLLARALPGDIPQEPFERDPRIAMAIMIKSSMPRKTGIRFWSHLSVGKRRKRNGL